jgi:PEP-CTERM/exosortase A-associated glycosyltransferase
VPNWWRDGCPLGGEEIVRALHLLYSAPPDGTGASIRSRYVVETQAKLGIEPIVLSSPFQAPADQRCAQGVEWIGGIPYHRCFNGDGDRQFMAARKPLTKRAGKLFALPGFTRRARQIARATGVDLIHAHSLFFCGLAGALAARSLGLPSVYEIRSLIEEGLVVQGGITTRSPLYRGYRFFEALAVRLATHITTISDGLRADLIDRGVPAQKITVIRNGVDPERQAPAAARSTEALARLGLPPDAFVIGYIGTLFTYESLDLLVAAMARLAAQMPALRVVLVGDGDAAPALRAAVAAHGLERIITFTGRVPHESVGEYYGLVDLFVLPRRSNRLSNLVTPLKPLEIMARGKAVLASDCGGHAELIRDGANGYLFPAGDVEALSRRIHELAQRSTELVSLGGAAREWVTRHRSWELMVAPTVGLYERLVGRAVGQRWPRYAVGG